MLTRPAAAAGRGRHVAPSPVEELAREAGIEVLSPVKVRDPQFLDRLAEIGPDCCPVVAYGALLPRSALDIPPHGFVNLHFSLLPAWRGAAPVQAALWHGDDVTGATTFEIEESLDSGPVYGVVTEPIGPTDTTGDLLARLAESGAGLLLATMDGIEAGTLRPQPQPADGVTLAPKITVADAEVDWSLPAFAVDRRVRACTPDPGAWTTFRDHRLNLGPLRPAVDAGEGGAAAGELRVERRRVLVGTGSGVVELGEVQAPGKRRMPAVDWARGVRPEAGERLG